jgi:hypothetical protein
MRQHTPAEWIALAKGDGREAGHFGGQIEAAYSAEQR